MELIPILSLIVLVATVSTFIFAVAAYVLYKIRERRGKTATEAKPMAIEGELIAPTPLMVEQRQTEVRPLTRKTAYVEEEEVIGRTTREYAPQKKETAYRRRTTDISHNDSDNSEHFNPNKKFMRYTQTGYVEPTRLKDNEKKGEKLKWR